MVRGGRGSCSQSEDSEKLAFRPCEPLFAGGKRANCQEHGSIRRFCERAPGRVRIQCRNGLSLLDRVDLLAGTVGQGCRGELAGRFRCAANVGRPVGERPIVRETERHVTRDQAERGDPPGPSGLTTGRRDPRILAPETSTRTHRPNRKRTQGMESPVASPTRPPRGGMGVPSLSKSGEGRTPDRNSGMRSWRHPGVSGWACGEGRPKEGGRSRRVPGTVAPSKQTVHGGRDDIRAHPERSPSALREVGRDHSTEESSVIEADGKGPYFGAAPEGQRDCPSPREG